MSSSLPFIQSWLTSKEAQSPLLLVSPDTMALQEEVAAIKLISVCTANQIPCNACVACKQATAGSHPDITELPAAEKMTTLKNVRTFLSAVRQTPFHNRRLLIIPLADRLSREGSNALLKALEEPPAYARFILTTSFKKRLLPTLLSRCQILLVPPKHIKNTATQEIPLPQFGQHQGTLSSEETDVLASYLQARLHQEGFSAPLYRSFLRLKDYYKIKSERGNEKLASEVLLATVESLK